MRVKDPMFGAGCHGTLVSFYHGSSGQILLMEYVTNMSHTKTVLLLMLTIDTGWPIKALSTKTINLVVLELTARNGPELNRYIKVRAQQVSGMAKVTDSY